MCWVRMQDQKPQKGDIVDIWVLRDGKGYRIPMVLFTGYDWHFINPITRMMRGRLELSPKAKITHFKPEPVGPYAT